MLDVRSVNVDVLEIDMVEQVRKEKWGFLREHSSKASGKDPLTGLHRTGLDEYLSVIFPDINDWIYNKAFGIHEDGINHKIRPDYRSDSLKLVVEFDGLPHYTNPANILRDDNNTIIYQKTDIKLHAFRILFN